MKYKILALIFQYLILQIDADVCNTTEEIQRNGEAYLESRESDGDLFSFGACSFDTDMCGYTVDQTSFFYWDRDFKQIPDHTQNKTDGGLIAVAFDKVTESEKGQETYLRSENLPPVGFETRCLTFWYQTDIPESNILRITVEHNKPNQSNYLIWEEEKFITGTWTYSQAIVSSNKEHNLVFYYEIKTQQKGYFAIDDIFLTSGPCSSIPQEAKTNLSIPMKPITLPPDESSPDYDCNFQYDQYNDCDYYYDYYDIHYECFCKWENENSNFKWQWQEGSSENPYSGPETDHTTGDYDYGAFIYIVPESPEEKKAQLISSRIPANYKCLRFWYHMWGENINTLNVYIKRNDTLGKPVWTRKKSQGNKWLEGQINIDEPYRYNIVFEALSSDEGIDGNIALDDISVRENACPTLGEQCDFEDLSICGYKTNLGMQRTSGADSQSLSEGSYPNVDHSFGTDYGHYLLALKTDDDDYEGSKFHLRSPNITLSDGYKCIRFWYSSGDFYSMLQVTSTADEDKTLFELSTERKRYDTGLWNVAEFSLSPSLLSSSDVSSLQLLFHITLMENDFIALDDIQIHNDFCGSAGECNFENGNLCSWKKDTNADIQWILTEEDKKGYNILTDHTLGSEYGTYLFVDTYSNQGKEARIYSQVFEITNHPQWNCLRFWYFIDTLNIGVLQVVQQFYDGRAQILWEVTGSPTVEWHYAQVAFNRAEDDSIIYFEAIAGEYHDTDIGIDDIFISNSYCSGVPLEAVNISVIPPTIPPPTPGLSLAAEIDCNFDDNFCNWKNKTVANNPEWNRGFLEDSVYSPPKKQKDIIGKNSAGLSIRLSRLNPEAKSSWKPVQKFKKNPKMYQTPNMHRGLSWLNLALDPYEFDSYLFVESDPTLSQNSVAEIHSDRVTVKQSLEFVCFHFTYYVFGSEVGNLTLTLHLPEENVTAWKAVGTQMDKWIETSVAIESKIFSMHFESEVGRFGVMALDDFSIDEAFCPSLHACQFEMHPCSWTNDEKSNLVWFLGRGIDVGSKGPPIDHSTGTSEGGYYYVMDNKKITDRKGRFLSPVYGENFGSQCLNFWYYMNGGQNDTLNIYLTDKTLDITGDSLWKRIGNRGKRWHLAMTSINMYDRFQIVIEANFNSKLTDGFVAVDDIRIVPGVCDLPGSCSFDEGFCGYSNDIEGDNFDWLLGFGRTHDPSKLKGLPNDVGEKGFYAYIDMTIPFLPFNASAVLRSDEILATPAIRSFCLEFYYVFFGESIQFSVQTNTLGNLTDGHPSVQWIAPITPVMKWKKITVSFNIIDEFEILFFVKREKGATGFIGIDEVKLFHSTNCSASNIEPPTNDTTDILYFCDFENGDTCDWKSSKEDYIKWNVMNGALPYLRNHYDHTKNNYKGHFLYAEISSYNPPPLYLTSPQPGSKNYQCFTFWYFMYGENIGRFNITLITQSEDKTIWSRSDNQGSVWRYAQIDINILTPHSITISYLSGNDRSGVVAVDDLALLDNPCPPEKLCTFDDGHLCTFSQSTNDQFDWSISGDKYESDVFPKDHTTNSKYGKYAYLNTQGRKTGDYAAIWSPVYPEVHSACLTFWFYMRNEYSNLWIGYKGVKSQTKYVFQLDSKIGDGWISTSIPFYPSSSWQVSFGSFAQNEAILSVAVDDVFFGMNETCGPNGFCDFESGMCNWENDETLSNTADWLRATTNDIALFPYDIELPPTDHTLKLPSGYYLYLEEDHDTSSYDYTIATLKSSVFPTTATDQCFSFWYYHSGPFNGTMEILLSTENLRDKHLKTFKILDTERKGEWKQIQVNITEEADSFQNLYMRLSIKTKIENFIGILALDDFLIENNNCKDTSAETFLCSNGEKSILELSVCDNVRDCEDGSDELNCGSCDFEHGLCKYTDVSVADFQWKFQSASDINPTQDGPPTEDHTYQNKSGHYLLNDGTDDYYYEAAVLHSPVIQQTSPYCHLSLWFYESAEDDYDYFEISLKTITGYERTISSYELLKSARNWLQLIHYIGQMKEPFTIKFSRENAWIPLALDDISMINCNFPDKKQPCDKDEFTCDNGECIQQSRFCDLTSDCSDHSDELSCESLNITTGCDFEDSDCEMVNIGQKLWIRQEADKNEYGYYSRFDHTKGSEGHYFLAEYGSSKVVTRVFQASSSCKMIFYYMISSQYATLKIFTRNFLNGKETLQLQRSIYHGAYFAREEILFNEDKNFQVILEAEVESYDEYVIIDDISFTNSCQKISGDLKNETNECDANQFQCSPTQCINAIKVCNFQPDCENGLDEKVCAMCNFESDSCGWIDNSAGIYKWQRHLENSNNSNSNYIMKVSRILTANSFLPRIVMASPKMTGTALTCTFKFKYQLSSKQGYLQLFYAGGNSDTLNPIETIISDDDNKWKTKMIDLGELPAGFQLYVEAVLLNSSWTSDVIIALNDLEFENCATRNESFPPEELDMDCDFDAGNLCNWHQDLSNEIRWLFGGNNSNNSYEPETDHTSGHGYYIYLKNTEEGDYYNTYSGILKSPLLPPSPRYTCLSFWYFIFGEHVRRFSVFLNNTLLWNVVGSQGNAWRQTSLPIDAATPFQIKFQGELDYGMKGSIGLDDIKFTMDVCPVQLGACNFENDMCQWNSSTWRQTLAYDYYMYDHTLESEEGHFLLSHVNSSSAVSPLYHSSSLGSCFQMFYYMETYEDGKLIVTLLNKDQSIFGIYTLFNTYDEDYGWWRYFEQSIPYDIDFRVELQTSFQHGYNDFIAVDDIQLKNGLCPQNGSCNFENNFCGYTRQSRLEWIRNSGKTASAYTGPSVDHTYGTDQGFYAFIEADNGFEGESAILLSQILVAKNIICLSFYYHMYGRDIGMLSVDLLSEDGDVNLIVIRGNQGDSWKLKEIEIQNIEAKFQIQFKGIFGNGTQGDIALDDITVTYEKCPNPMDLKTTYLPTIHTKPQPTVPHSSNAPPDVTTSIHVTDTTNAYHTGTDITNTVSVATTDSENENRTPSPKYEYRKGYGWVAAPVLIGLIIIILVTLYIYKKKRNTGSREERMQISIDNPTYDNKLPSDDTRKFVFGDSDTSVPMPASNVKDSDGISNPLYA